MATSILDLDSMNPIVAYKNQLYSCTWVDMIGTNMFFTPHEEASSLEPLKSTPHCDLIGTSRMKLVGRLAKTSKIQKKQNKKRFTTTAAAAEADDDDEIQFVGESLVSSVTPISTKPLPNSLKLSECS